MGGQDLAQLATLTHRYFAGRPDVFACETVSEGRVGFQPHPAALTPQMVYQYHLSGHQCLGVYLLDLDNRCWASCLDFDAHGDTTPDWEEPVEILYYELTSAGITPLVERSQSGKGCHVWLLFDHPIEAWKPREFWKALLDRLALRVPEIYPRQDQHAAGSKGYGNLIRLPLWNESAFLCPETDWQVLDPLETLASASRLSEGELEQISHALGLPLVQHNLAAGGDLEAHRLPHRVQKLVTQHHTLLGRRWEGDASGMQDTSNSALVQAIACELVRQLVPTPEIEVALRFWCDEHSYQKAARADWIARTISKAYDWVAGKSQKRDQESANQAVTFRDACYSAIDQIGQDQALLPYSTETLRNSIDGMQGGELIIISARPSHGKTAMGVEQMLHLSMEHQVPSLLISEEMSNRELARRMLRSMVRDDLNRPQNERWMEYNKDKAKAEVDKHLQAAASCWVAESAGTIDRVEQLAESYVHAYGVKLVVIDYLQLLSVPGVTDEYTTITEVSKRLKRLARRLDVTVVSLAQLNRGIEDPAREWKPRMSDLRGSGQIEQDADVILFLMWPWLVDNTYEDPRDYWVYCLKRRNGPLRRPFMRLRWDASLQKFSDPQPQEQ